MSIIIACSSPLDKKFSEETAKQDLKELEEKIDSTDINLIVGTMVRFAFENKDFNGMTYREILKDGRKWEEEQVKIEAEQKVLAEKAAKEESDRIERLRSTVIVSCYEKGFESYDYEDYITYKFVIKNQSNKEIRAIKGSVTFSNLFDDEIKTLNFVYDQPIEPDNEVTWSASTNFNQFMDDDVALKSKDLKDLKVIWKPEKIIFTDGSSLE